MRHRAAILFAVASVLLFMSARGVAAASRLADAPLLAFGDSLTDGVGGAGENYPARLSALIGRRVINAGLPGEITAEGLRRLPAVLDRERPALLILALGVNDLLRKLPEDDIRRNLSAMLAVAREREVPVLLLAVPAPGSASAHPLYAQVAAEGGALLDAESLVRVLTNPALKADLVHPNREGYRVLAEGLAHALRAQKALP